MPFRGSVQCIVPVSKDNSKQDTFKLQIDPPKADPQMLRPTQTLIPGNYRQQPSLSVRNLTLLRRYGALSGERYFSTMVQQSRHHRHPREATKLFDAISGKSSYPGALSTKHVSSPSGLAF